MRFLLFFLSCFPFLLGVIFAANAAIGSGVSAVVAINQAGTMFLIWAVLFGSASIVDAIINTKIEVAKPEIKNENISRD